MTDLNDAISLLRGKRDDLSAQLDAVNKALAALCEADRATAAPPGGPVREAPQEAPGEVLPTRIESPRMLTDEHKFALKEGRRRALHSKEAAAGRARELRDPAPGLAPASATDSLQPRLVKRPKD
jgi:hypothetical protein